MSAITIAGLPVLKEDAPVTEPRRRAPRRRWPSQHGWYSFLDALRLRAARQWEILRLRAERGELDEPEEPDPPASAFAFDTSETAPRPRPRPRAEPVRPAATHGAGRNAPCPCGSGRKFKQCCRGKGAEFCTG